eukprot:12416131-Karenia_brevis.AAC.1
MAGLTYVNDRPAHRLWSSPQRSQQRLEIPERVRVCAQPKLIRITPRTAARLQEKLISLLMLAGSLSAQCEDCAELDVKWKGRYQERGECVLQDWTPRKLGPRKASFYRLRDGVQFKDSRLDVLSTSPLLLAEFLTQEMQRGPFTLQARKDALTYFNRVLP